MNTKPYPSTRKLYFPIVSLLLTLLFCLCSSVAKTQIQEIGQELQRLSFIKDSVGMVNRLNRLGTLYRTRNADSCFYYGMEAKRVATGIRYRKGQIDADHLIAFALFKKGLYAESLELLSKVLSHYQKIDDTEKIIRVYMDMAEVMNKDIVEKAEVVSLLQKAIQTGKKLEKDSIMSEVYIYYCNRNTSLSEDSTHYYINKSREIASRYNDKNMLIFNQLWQASLLIANGQKEQALPLIKQSLYDAQYIGNAILEINSLMTLFNYENNLEKKLEYLYQEYGVAQKSGDKYLEVYVLNSALAIANELGDKDEIIKVYVKLEKAMAAEWENSKKFMGDYVRYNSIEQDNKLLNEKNARRALWLVVISAIASIIVLAISLIMLRSNRKAKEQIEALNNMANLQIIAMEEEKQQAIMDERQRLGQDLHDGLASSMASVKHQLEVLSIDVDDIPLKNKLDALKVEITNAYEVTRKKSHGWFSAAEEQQGQSFEIRIKKLMDSALADSRYNKTIHIDDNALSHVTMDTRIALLRIIQEAITNIIKHAKAKQVSILVYQEVDSLTLSIKDDGKGLDRDKLKNGNATMGIQSIRRRVQYLNGEIEILSDTDNGTEITISIPLKSL